MSLVGVIASFATGTYDVLRTVPGDYTQGRYTAGAQTSILIEACIQPTSGRELQDMPEGQWGDEIKVIYTTTELKTRTPTSEPDLIIINEEEWVIIRSEHWEYWGEQHWRAYAARLVVP